MKTPHPHSRSRIHELPTDRRRRLDRVLASSLRDPDPPDLVGFIITGAVLGAIAEILPLDFLTGIDDWIQLGASLGAAIGYLMTASRRRSHRILSQLHAEGSHEP